MPAWGFDPYWYTAISGEGAGVLASVLRAWSGVFENGPTMIGLTGFWGATVGDSGSGHYERLVFARDPLLESLKAVAGLAEQAIGPDHWLLHRGI